jgi:hypothetical protein
MSDILKMAADGRAEELRHDLRRRALSSLFYFAKVVCSYRELSVTYHKPFCELIEADMPVRKRGYLRPRGHFKSTIIAKAYTHWRLCGGGQLDTMPELLELNTPELLAFYASYPERDPRNLRIGIIGETEIVAAKDLKDIKDRTLNNELFQWLFPELLPEDVGKTKWTETEIVLPRTKSFDESTITCMGVGSKRTGFHYDILIYDDPIGEASSHSEPIMNDALEWLKAAPGLLNDPATGEELFAGTRWKHGTADVYGWFIQNLPYVPASEGLPASGFKFHTESCYFEPTKEPRFKERFSERTLEEIRKREGEYLFNCNYRNTPTSPEGSVLAGYKFYEVIEDADGKPRIARFQDGTPDVHINGLARLSFLDPSSGGKTAKCQNACVVVGTDDLNRHLLLAVWAANTGYAGAVEAWHELNDRYVCWWNGYEQIGTQKEIESIVMMRGLYSTKCPFCQKTHRLLAPQAFKPPTGLDKNSRIEMYLNPPIRDGRLYVRKDQVEAIRQLDMFPHGDMVDIVDALASAVKNSRPYRGNEEDMEENKERELAVATGSSYSRTKVNYGGYGR